MGWAYTTANRLIWLLAKCFISLKAQKVTDRVDLESLDITCYNFFSLKAQKVTERVDLELLDITCYKMFSLKAQRGVYPVQKGRYC